MNQLSQNTINKPIFIAEIKTKSPYGFTSYYSEEFLTNLATQYGDWISVHTSPEFGGSFDKVVEVRKLTNKPILAKGYHKTDKEVSLAFEKGADYVLVIDRLITSPKIISEFTSIYKYQELCKKSKLHPDAWVIYNNRDLYTGLRKDDRGYAIFRSTFKKLIGASFISKRSDIPPLCDAYLVGEKLPQFIHNEFTILK